MTLLSALGAFILGLQHAIEPENIAISLFIGSLGRRNCLKYLIVYLVTLSFMDILLGSFLILIGQYFTPIPEFIIKPAVGVIFILLGVLLIRRTSRQSLKSRIHKETGLLVPAIAGLLHSFILDPHHPLFFAMLPILRSLRQAILMLSSFVVGIIVATSVMVLAIATISTRVSEKKLGLIQRLFGAIIIAVGIMHLAF